MQKNILTLFLLLTVSQTALCGVVPSARAKAEAEQFLKELAPGQTPKLKLLFETPRMTKAGPTDPEYYIFENESGGFVIAGGDDTVPAILGYSTTNPIQTERMPQNLRSWLDMWAQYVDNARLNGTAPCVQPARTKSGDGSAKLLETALWDQDHPFNDQCYVIDTQHALTGCVATATAIVMRYFQYPEKGEGTLASYSYTDSESGKAYTVPGRELGTTYNWSEMPLRSFDVTWTKTEIKEVAQLMSDIGVMIQANYGLKGTSAYVMSVPGSLARYMDYDAAAYSDFARFYTPEEWISRIKDNINNIGPVLYSGQGEESGHAFILDGYDERDYLHINWGWSGKGNGYFIMPQFDEFTTDHEMCFGLRPNQGGTHTELLRISDEGLSSSTSSFAVGKPFKVSAYYVYNFADDQFNGEIAFAKFNGNDNLVELISPTLSTSIDSYHGTSISYSSCVISTPIEVLDYISVVYRSARKPEWTRAYYDVENGTVGKLYVGDEFVLEDIISLDYDTRERILTVSSQKEFSCGLLLNGSTVNAGVTAIEGGFRIDANLLSPSSYTLRLKYGVQQKDIVLKFGNKK